jgi:hypothetical protein
MEDSSLSRGLGRYWILYLQPAPEAGERISIAIVLESPKGTSVEYDRRFAKVRKLYPGFDTDVLTFYLESLRRELASSESGVDPTLVLASYGPQLMASAARRVAVPITDATISMMLIRYVLPTKPDHIRVLAAAAQEAARDPVAREIEAFVLNRVGPVSFRSFASPHDIVGHSIRGVRPVAMAIPGPAGWTLVDGVDLNKSSAAAAIKRANEIGRTFWNYAQLSHHGSKILSVGVILNGNSHLAPVSAEAHDYILHRFKSDANEAIDAHSTESAAKLRNLLMHGDDRLEVK